MCGVLLIYSKKNKLNRNICTKSLKTLEKRGPDRTLSNYFLNDHLFIGNTILNIVGPIKNKKNLYKSNSNRFKISFNGEIYNYKKFSKINKFLINPVNDTDLLANIHDHKNEFQVVKLLEGMFAYCVFDEKNKKISFASDPQGEKKLFFYNDNEYLICCSNILGIKKFLEENNIKFKIDENRFKDYFDTRHFLFLNDSIYNKISYIEPGVLYSYFTNSNKIKTKKFDDPIQWINKKKYQKFNKSKDYTFNYFDNLFQSVARKMIPDIPFTSLMSGGIDSSFQLKIISNLYKKYIKHAFFVDHGKKDPISKKLKKFEKFLNPKLKIIKLNAKKYYLNLNIVYKSIFFPFFSHDLVGRFLSYKFCSQNKYKVVFIGEGADEIFGGYKAYKSINWNNKKITNPSPYSTFANDFSDKKQKIKTKSEKIWMRAFKKYNKFLSIKESKMQATLFTDYFVQAVGNTNIATDLLSGENSIETRNIYITKEIIKNAINLPIKYKINFQNNSSFVLKPLLKSLFSKYISKKLVYKKQGFSGFPNESSKFLKKADKKKLTSLINKFKLDHPLNRASEWKLINCFYFKKFCNMKIALENLF